MQLKRIGYYKEMPHGQDANLSIHDFIGKEDPAIVRKVCNYLNTGIALIVSPGTITDIIEPERGFSGTATAYTDGTWIWPGDLAYYVENYRLCIPNEFRETMMRNGWKIPISEESIAEEEIEIDGILI